MDVSSDSSLVEVAPVQWTPAAEVVAFFGLAELATWGGHWVEAIILVVILLLVGLCVASNVWHGDSRERVGLGGAQFWPALKLGLLVTLPVMIPLFVMGSHKRLYWPWDLAWAMAGYPVWGFAQEYALLGFVNNRVEDALPKHPALIPWINGFLFSMCHLPNPILMLFTFVAGGVFTLIFRRHRNLFAIALVHALMGIAISLAFADINGIMSVGPGYAKRLGEPLLLF